MIELNQQVVDRDWEGFATPFGIFRRGLKSGDEWGRLRKHEECHVRQWWRYLIIGFPIVYLWQLLVTHDYATMPLEIEAREAEIKQG